LTFEEGPDGRVFIQVTTPEPLGDIVLGPQTYSPEAYLSQGVTFECFGTPQNPPLLPVVRAGSFLTKLVDRYVDISIGSEERRLIERMAEQEETRVVWLNERLEFTLPPRPGFREYLAQAAAQKIDHATWREAVAESEWQSSASWRPGVPRPRRRAPRKATPPPVRVPYFSKRSGAVPGNGTSTIADVALPRGSRFPSFYAGFWCTDDGGEEMFALASRLTAAFDETGLWPLLWDYPEDPDAYLGGAGNVDSVDGVDVSQVLAERWRRHTRRPEWVAPLGVEFPGLAEATEVSLDRPDPFVQLHEHRRSVAGSLDPRLMLVPCNRPADAITAVGFDPVGVDVADVSAVLRSWEERFGAVAVELEPSVISLSVDAPPRTEEQALLIAAEQHALAPWEDAGRPGALLERARVLLGDATPPRLWECAFTH
jgi:hypothetical protein